MSGQRNHQKKLKTECEKERSEPIGTTYKMTRGERAKQTWRPSGEKDITCSSHRQ